MIPILILAAMAIPSFRLLYKQDVIPDAGRVADLHGINVDGELTIKATGHQWWWTYEYPDDGVYFDAFMKFDEQLEAGDPRLLATDNRVVVPVNTLVKVLLTADDVIHAWAVPANGVKQDAVPGRVTETWFIATREGAFYGQCSELCGANHGFMPIPIDVVSRQQYDAWLASQVALAPRAPADPARVALGAPASLGRPRAFSTPVR